MYNNDERVFYFPPEEERHRRSDKYKNQEVQSTEKVSKDKEQKNNLGQRVKAKISKKTLAILLALSIGTTACLPLAKSIRNTKAEKARATSIVTSYLVNDGTYTNGGCEFTDKIYSKNSYDQKICDAKYILESLEKNNVNYLKIGETYYTEDGEPFAFLTFKLKKIMVTDSIGIDLTNNGSIYMPTQGFEISENQDKLDPTICTKEVEEIITIRVPRREQKDYETYTINQLASDRFFEGLAGYELINVSDDFEVRAYSELPNYYLIADVDDEYNKVAEETYEAKLRLVPKH